MERNIIVLLRHGETNLAKQGIIQGQSNEATLTENGIKQVENACKLLEPIEFDAMFSSPIRRAAETSDIVRKSIALRHDYFQYEERLKEIDFKNWTGLSKMNILKSDSQRFNLWKTSPYDLRFDDFFPVRDLYSRIQEFCTHFINPNARPSKTIVSAHKGTIQSIVVTLLGFRTSRHNFLNVDHGSLTVLRELSRNNNKVYYEIIVTNLKSTPIPIEAIIEI